jgi:Domain of unknown function (DUF4430)
MRLVVGGLIAAVVLIGAAAAAIGLRTGSGEVSGTVSLTVTHEFGAEPVADQTNAHAKSGDTVMRLLERDFDVHTRYGGGFVQEIDGIAGGREDGRPVDWFYYVNGIESPIGAAQRHVSPGDHIWWDRHIWQAAQRVPAVVGSFPEPFLAGENGQRIPVKVVCLAGVARSCDEVEQRLTQAGATGVARSTIEQGPGEGVLRVIVGRWADVRRDPVARTLERGPGASGVYVRIDPSGQHMQLLDELGQTVRTLGGGAGLVAATSQEGQQPTWVVTGSDDVGVDAAAAALQENRLQDHFAVAISAGHDIPLPTAEPGSGPSGPSGP